MKHCPSNLTKLHISICYVSGINVCVYRLVLFVLITEGTQKSFYFCSYLFRSSTPYIRIKNVLSASLNKTFPSFLFYSYVIIVRLIPGWGTSITNTLDTQIVVF